MEIINPESICIAKCPHGMEDILAEELIQNKSSFSSCDQGFMPNIQILCKASRGIV